MENHDDNNQKIEKNQIDVFQRTTAARQRTAGKPKAEITMTLVINHIKSEHGLESRML